MRGIDFYPCLAPRVVGFFLVLSRRILVPLGDLFLRALNFYDEHEIVRGAEMVCMLFKSTPVF